MIQIAIVEDEEIYVKQFGDGEDIDDQIKKSSTNK